MTQPYDLELTRPAARALAVVLPEKAATAAYEFIYGVLREDPRRVGKPMRPPLAPAWCARRGSYRIHYVIHEERRTVEVLAVKHRADAYRT